MKKKGQFGALKLPHTMGPTIYLYLYVFETYGNENYIS